MVVEQTRLGGEGVEVADDRVQKKRGEEERVRLGGK